MHKIDTFRQTYVQTYICVHVNMQVCIFEHKYTALQIKKNEGCT